MTLSGLARPGVFGLRFSFIVDMKKIFRIGSSVDRASIVSLVRYLLPKLTPAHASHSLEMHA